MFWHLVHNKPITASNWVGELMLPLPRATLTLTLQLVGHFVNMPILMRLLGMHEAVWRLNSSKQAAVIGVVLSFASLQKAQCVLC